MGFVNVMAIDRSNRERARQTVEAATARIRSGRSFGVFAEGTRAKPGEFLPFKRGRSIWPHRLACRSYLSRSRTRTT